MKNPFDGLNSVIERAQQYFCQKYQPLCGLRYV